MYLSISICLFLAVLWPPLALFFSIVVLSASPSLLNRGSAKLAISLAIGAVGASRTIPALPSDDLEEYLVIFETVSLLAFIDFLEFVRYEPLFYLLSFAVDFDYSKERFVLFIIVSSIAFLYLHAVVNSLSLTKLSYGFSILAIALFPYEIVSSIPRQMFAIFLLQAMISAKRARNFGAIVLSLLSHKTAIVVAFFSVFVYSNFRFWAILAGSFLIVLFGYEFIISNIQSDVFDRMRSYFFREGGSGRFPLIIFTVVMAGSLVFRGLRPLLWLYLPILALAVAMVDIGPMSIRLAYYGYIPGLIVVFAAVHRINFKKNQERALILILACSVLIIRIYAPNNGDHDPFSEVDFAQMVFFPLRAFLGAYD